jgi:Tol biopolymer transport system component
VKLAPFVGAIAAVAVFAASGAARPAGWSYASPTWSPDGHAVMFVRARGPVGEILVARASGGGLRRVAAAPIVSQAAWSPDGTRIAYVSCGRVFVVRRDGTGRRALGRGASVVWAGDSAHLAFDGGGQGPIRVANADGSGRHAVTSGPYDRTPSWSPDGAQLLFSRTAAIGGPASVYAVGRDGGDARALGIDGADASWSPDGKRVAVWRRQEEGVALTVTTVERREAILVTRTLPAYSGAARWSPDGTKLAFTACSEFGACRVDIADSNGADVLILGSGGEPSWSPDGTRVAFTARRFCRWSSVFTVGADGRGLTRLTPCR